MGWFSKAARDSFDSSCHCGFTRNSIVRSSMETNGNWAELVALGDCHLNGIPGSDWVVPSYPPLFSHQNSVGLNVRPPSKWVWLMDSVPKSHLEITAKTKRVYPWPRLSSLDIIGGPFWLPSVLEWPENALPPAENHESNETIKKVLQLKNIWGSVENYHDLKIIMTWRSLCFHIKTLESNGRMEISMPNTCQHHQQQQRIFTAYHNWGASNNAVGWATHTISVSWKI